MKITTEILLSDSNNNPNSEIFHNKRLAQLIVLPTGMRSRFFYGEIHQYYHSKYRNKLSDSYLARTFKYTENILHLQRIYYLEGAQL